MRARIGWWLRRLADRIDYPNAPKAIGWSFTFEQGKGMVFRQDQHRGCRLWYLTDADYERAHTEALSADARVTHGPGQRRRSSA